MNLLPLDTWRQIMAFHPFHFWGMADNSRIAVTSACNGLVSEYGWQATDAASRSEIRAAIEQAEKRLTEELLYSPAPRYTEATVPWPRYLDPTLMRVVPAGADGRWLTVQLPEGYVQAVGVEQLTVIQAAAPVTLSDVDSDGYNDTFTLGPIATTVTDPDEIAIYFAAADRFNGPDYTNAVGDRWRVLPVNVTVSGGFVTITGARWLIVPPLKYEGVVGIGSGLNPQTATNAVTTLDIYRRSTNTSGTTTSNAQATIEWSTHPDGCNTWWCQCGCSTPVSAYGGSPFDPNAVARAAGRVDLHNARLGIVGPAESAYNATTGVWATCGWTVCTEPDRVTVRTLSGYPLASDGQMDARWRLVVARLAAAELARPICACDEASRELYRWQYDLARTSGAGDEAYGAVSAEDLNNPFGTRRGHVYAWKFAQDQRHLRGLLA